MTVGVESYQAPVYSDRLIASLRATKLFDRVDDVKNFSTPPDLIASVDYGIYGTPTFPVRTFATMGILPTRVTEQHGEAFSLRSSRCQDKKIPIEFKYTGEATLGWSALVLNLRPDHTKREVENHALYRDNLALRVVRQKDAIDAMRRQGC
jgi:hypothetical protein